jgi:Flp pilus assembly protein TadG
MRLIPIRLVRAVRRRPPTRGQALVEFALTLPIFLLLIFGLIDMGRFVFGQSTLSQAAREGARLGAVEAFWVGNTTDPSCNQTGGPVCPADVAALRSDIAVATNRMMTPFGTISASNVHVHCDAAGAAPPTGSWTATTDAATNCTASSARQPQGTVSVRVVMQFQPITPIIGQLFSGITEVGSATMVIN